GVKAHWEKKELPLYGLVLARPDGALGPRLRRSDIDCAALRIAARGGPPVAPSLPTPSAGGLICTGGTIPGHITGGALSMNALANSLGRFVRRVVENRTGLTGGFDFELTWTPEQSPNEATGAPELKIDPNGPSIFTALQEQLGLKLEAGKGPVD